MDSDNTKSRAIPKPDYIISGLVHAARHIKIDFLQLNDYAAVANPGVRVFLCFIPIFSAVPLEVLLRSATTAADTASSVHRASYCCNAPTLRLSRLDSAEPYQGQEDSGDGSDHAVTAGRQGSFEDDSHTGSWYASHNGRLVNLPNVFGFPLGVADCLSCAEADPVWSPTSSNLDVGRDD